MVPPDPASRIDWLDLPAIRLGMTDVATALRQRPQDGVDTLVLLVEDTELEGAPAPATATIRYPIPDMGLPQDRTALDGLITRLRDDLQADRAIVIACQAGYGRTGTVAACLLIALGATAEEAIQHVRTARPGTIETDAQLEFVRAFRWV